MLTSSKSGLFVRLLFGGAARPSADMTVAPEPKTSDVGPADVLDAAVASDRPGNDDKGLAHEFVGRFDRVDRRCCVLDGKTQLGYRLKDWLAVTSAVPTT